MQGFEEVRAKSVTSSSNEKTDWIKNKRIETYMNKKLWVKCL